MSFKSENNELLKFILDTAFFSGWSDKNCSSDLNGGSRVSSLELYVTSECNQKCEYCYLNRYGDKLYPAELRNEKTILSNLDILLKYAVKNWPYLKHIDIFSGEIVGTQIFFNVLDIIKKYKEQGLNELEEIIVPTNFSFIHSQEMTEKVQNYIDDFNKNYNIRLVLSASIDGYIIEDFSRPQKIYHKRDMDFYHKSFQFMKKNGFCAHPMIAACSVDKWIENYKWFIDMCEQYDFNILQQVMTLEVRNDDWTDEAISHYQEFLKFYCDYHFEHRYDSNPRKFAKMSLGLNEERNGYTNFLLLDATQFPTCSVAYQLTVRLGDLSIAPCHRTAYPEFLYGKFIVENNEIIDIEANNPVIATKILLSNQRKTHHGCDTCWNVNSCIRGCFGAQYEYGDEPFMPLHSVCKMFKAKTRCLIQWYKDHGIIDAIKQIAQEEKQSQTEIQKFIETFEEIDKRSQIEE